MGEMGDASAFARALAARDADATRIRVNCGVDTNRPVEPLDIERCFSVACVAVPHLCIGAACRWALRGAGNLPPCIHHLMLGDSIEAGRPLRGACLAFRGKALLLADERDDASEQRYSLLHEAAHFFLHHQFPREEAIRRLGPGIASVLDGKRAPSISERFDAIVRRADLDFHTHLYRRDAPGRSDAETDADALACLLIAPIASGASAPSPADLVRIFALPMAIAERYSAAWQIWREVRPRRHPLLERFGL